MTPVGTSILARILRRFRRSEDGASTIEFVIWFPFFITVLCSGLEAGIYSMQNAMLERSLDLTIRDLRLGGAEPPTHNDLKEKICDRATMLNKCDQSLLLELYEVDNATWTMPPVGAKCIDKVEEITPATTFALGVTNQMVIVRACMMVKTFFPTTGLGLAMKKDANGYYAMIATSAYVNEPR